MADVVAVARSTSSRVSDVALDLIIETLISSPDAYQRSVFVLDLVEEIAAILSWLDVDERELASVAQVLEAACEHRRRMERDRSEERGQPTTGTQLPLQAVCGPRGARRLCCGAESSSVRPPAASAPSGSTRERSAASTPPR